MRKTVETLLRRFGCEIIVRRGEKETVFQGLLHHTGSRSWQNMERIFSPLGEIPRGQYVLVAPTAPSLQAGDILLLEDRRYRLCRLEKEYLAGKVIFQWGLCTETGGEDTWGSQL